jgi:hypothetical protein
MHDEPLSCYLYFFRTEEKNADRTEAISPNLLASPLQFFFKLLKYFSSRILDYGAHRRLKLFVQDARDVASFPDSQGWSP